MRHGLRQPAHALSPLAFGKMVQLPDRLVLRLHWQQLVAGSLQQRPSKRALRLPWRAVDN